MHVMLRAGRAAVAFPADVGSLPQVGGRLDVEEKDRTIPYVVRSVIEPGTGGNPYGVWLVTLDRAG